MVTAYRGTQSELFSVLKDDFTGSNNFVYWVLAVILVVAVGNIKQLKRVSDAFLVLLVIVIVVSQYKYNKDLLGSFIEQIKRGTSGSNKLEPVTITLTKRAKQLGSNLIEDIL